MKQDNVKDVDVPVGTITFGGTDPDNCGSVIANVNLKSDTTWWFNIDAVEVGNHPLHYGPFLASFFS